MTWEDLQLESLNCPVLYQAVTLANSGQLTREQALIEAAIWLSRHRQGWLKREQNRLMRENARPIVVDEAVFDRAHGLRPPEGRCNGRYPVPQTSPPRDEPFDVTYRCALSAGHDGPHRGEP